MRGVLLARAALRAVALPAETAKPGMKLNYFSPVEPFFVYLRIAALRGRRRRLTRRAVPALGVHRAGADAARAARRRCDRARWSSCCSSAACCSSSSGCCPSACSSCIGMAPRATRADAEPGTLLRLRHRAVPGRRAPLRAAGGAGPARLARAGQCALALAPHGARAGGAAVRRRDHHAHGRRRYDARLTAPLLRCTS